MFMLIMFSTLAGTVNKHTICLARVRAGRGLGWGQRGVEEGEMDVDGRRGFRGG